MPLLPSLSPPCKKQPKWSLVSQLPGNVSQDSASCGRRGTHWGDSPWFRNLNIFSIFVGITLPILVFPGQSLFNVCGIICVHCQVLDILSIWNPCLQVYINKDFVKIWRNFFFEILTFLRGSGVLPKRQQSWNISLTKEARIDPKVVLESSVECNFLGIFFCPWTNLWKQTKKLLYLSYWLQTRPSPLEGSKQQFICFFVAVLSSTFQSPLLK